MEPIGVLFEIIDISGTNYRGLPKISTLHQIVAEGGQHGFRYFDYNNKDRSGCHNMKPAWVSEPRPRLCNKNLLSLRCFATAHNMRTRVGQIQVSHGKKKAFDTHGVNRAAGNLGKTLLKGF